MPGMGDLLEGYLYRKRELEEEEIAKEEKQRQKLQDQLADLNLKNLQREMERSAYEYEQKKKWHEGLEGLSPEQILEARYGIEPKEPERPESPWQVSGDYMYNTQTGEYRRLPTTETKTPSGVQKTAADILEYFQMPGASEFTGPVSREEEVTRQAYGMGLRQHYPKAFGEKKKSSSLFEGLGILGGRETDDPTRQKKLQIDAALKSGTSKEEIKNAIDTERALLEDEGVDVGELYRYLGF